MNEDLGEDVDMGSAEEEEDDEEEGERMEMHLSSDATTIDPGTSVKSRILVSRSLQAADAAAGQTRTANDDEKSNDQQQQQQPRFGKLSAVQASAGNRVEYRRVRCPPHRYTPLREHWEQILTPLVEYLKLQVRMRSSSSSSLCLLCSL